MRNSDPSESRVYSTFATLVKRFYGQRVDLFHVNGKTKIYDKINSLKYQLITKFIRTKLPIEQQKNEDLLNKKHIILGTPV